MPIKGGGTLYRKTKNIESRISCINIESVYIENNKNNKENNKMLKELAIPDSLNCDFELAAINALKKVYKEKEVKIYGCFFHFSQSLFRRVQTHSCLKFWNDTVIGPKYRKAFHRLQSLAFVHPNETVRFRNLK